MMRYDNFICNKEIKLCWDQRFESGKMEELHEPKTILREPCQPEITENN